MPPANRHEPRRAKSLTSDYSVTEVPDDAACYLDEYAWHYDDRRTGQRSMFHSLVREAANQ